MNRATVTRLLELEKRATPPRFEVWMGQSDCSAEAAGAAYLYTHLDTGRALTRAQLDRLPEEPGLTRIRVDYSDNWRDGRHAGHH